jgi:hypothetical protein
LKALRRLAPKLADLEKMDSMPTPEQLETVLDAVHSALVRRYPELTKDDVEEALDLENLRPILEAVMGAAGLKRGGPGEAVGPVTLTGPTSTGSL